jgi:hypothetical protein
LSGFGFVAAFGFSGRSIEMGCDLIGAVVGSSGVVSDFGGGVDSRAGTPSVSNSEFQRSFPVSDMGREERSDVKGQQNYPQYTGRGAARKVGPGPGNDFFRVPLRSERRQNNETRRISVAGV